MTACRTLRFVLGHERQEIGAISPITTVLDWLRIEKSRTGTKEGCAEGDCGACTVLVGRLDGDRVRYEAINACIRFMPTLHGCHLLTVEHLRRPDGALHPVQEAMVECHGSQCGFCTPGFVMALFALYLNEDRPSDDRIRDALAGNLCRCTGYAPIIAAARRMYDIGDRAREPLVMSAGDLRTKLGLPSDNGTLTMEGAEGRFAAPDNVGSLAGLLVERPQATIVSGATDIGLWVTKQLRRLPDIVYLGRIAEMHRITETAAGLEIGGGATFTEAEAYLARSYPDFGELLRRTGGIQVRNMGTLGGNIANGSPIGDSMPALIALGATLVLRRGDAPRHLPLEDFFIDYGKQDRLPGEFVEKILIPKLPEGAHFHAYKISKRFDQDISAVCGAFRITVIDSVVRGARIAFGGMAGTPRRAPRAEAALVDKPWNRGTIMEGMAALDEDFSPLTDWRASALYRRTVAKNLLLKAFIESAPGALATRLVGAGKVAYA